METSKRSHPTSEPLRIFIRCGERYSPPESGAGWLVVTLPENLDRRGVSTAVKRVREALRETKRAEVLIAGPVSLGVALGQALAHEPVAIDYLQLNQATKEFEVWVTNRRNL